MVLLWIFVFLKLKDMIQSVSGEMYNVCLFNFYYDGSEGMVWYSDVEKDLKFNGVIGFFSFGVE